MELADWRGEYVSRNASGASIGSVTVPAQQYFLPFRRRVAGHPFRRVPCGNYDIAVDRFGVAESAVWTAISSLLRTKLRSSYAKDVARSTTLPRCRPA